MSILLEKNYTNEQCDAIGTKFLLSNGYFGYRGTLDEDSKDNKVAVNINGIFDIAEGFQVEPINVYNPLYTKCFLSGNPITRNFNTDNEHRIELNLKDGVLTRATQFNYEEAVITITSERFVDQENLHMIYSKYTIRADKPVTVEMFTGIDTDVWNMRGDHLYLLDKEKSGQKLVVKGFTKTDNKKVLIGLMSVRNFRHRDNSEEDSIFYYDINIQPDREYEILKYACIMHSDDVDYDKMDEYLESAKEMGYDAIKEQNERKWKEIWDDARVYIFNNDLADKISQYACFQLVCHRPYSDYVSVPMKGLSGQYENGAYNWLNEFFLFKFYMNTFPEAARHMIMNRIKGIDGAFALAKHFGFNGVLYPQYVSSNGFPIDYELENKEFIHVNAMIIYTLYEYIFRTNDISILFDGGLRMAIETAKFYIHRAKINDTKTHYDFPKVSGIDRNHNNVTNSAFTNRLIKHNFDVVLKMITMVKTNDKHYWERLFDKYGYTKDILKLREIRRKFYLKNPNVNKINEQFDNYFDLEDIKISEWKKRSKDKNFNRSKCQIVENPEIFAINYLFPYDYELPVKIANYDFYFNRLSSRKYMSKTLSILMACEINNTRRAYKQFMNLGELDITKTKRFNDGLDILNCGAIYTCLVYGFAGLRFNENLNQVNLWLPNDIRRIEFHIKHLGRKGFVKIKRNISSIDWE